MMYWMMCVRVYTWIIKMTDNLKIVFETNWLSRLLQEFTTEVKVSGFRALCVIT